MNVAIQLKEMYMLNIKSLLLKTLGIMLTFSAVLVVSTVVLAADSYPSKPVRIIAPTAPGGGQDIFARIMATKLSERLGKRVVVENRAGGGSIIGVDMVAKSAPDGYTLLIVNATQTVQAALQKLPYEPVKSFSPVAKLGNGLLVLTVHPSVPANSLKELIALAKKKPGAIVFAGSGIGSVNSMATELFKIMADIDFKIVQFKSAGPGIIDLLGGHSQAMIGTIAPPMPHIRSGKLKALATSGAKRSFLLADLPTIAEAGVPGYEATNFYGIFAPAGTPTPIVDRLNRDIKAILALDETKKIFINEGVETDYQGPTEFSAFFVQEIDKWARVIKEANITVETISTEK